MRVVALFGTLTALMLAPAAVLAQGEPGLRISIEATTVLADGGERVSLFGLVPTTGRDGAHQHSVSIMPHGCAGGMGPYVVNEAVAGWHVWITPVAESEGAVTFRILWERSPAGNADAWNPGREQEVTMRLGQSMPLDVISAPPGRASERTCSAVGLRVGIIAWPPPEQDRRLVSTDLWLIHRLPDGTERSQQVSLRGLFNQVTPFHFETVEDNGVLLDFQGELTAVPDARGGMVKLTTTSRVVQGGVVSSILRDADGMMRGREVRATVPLAADETVTVDLPRLGENTSGAFANHVFTIRVRSVQVR